MWQESRRIDRHPLWMSDAIDLTFLTQQREGVGTTFRCRTEVGPFVTNDLMTITERIEPSTIGVEHHGVITGRGVFSLVGDENATTITRKE